LSSFVGDKEPANAYPYMHTMILLVCRIGLRIDKFDLCK
jgi:hypothetical protein